MNDRQDPSGAGSEGREPEDAGLSMDEKFARLVASVDGSTVVGPGAKEEAAKSVRRRAAGSAKVVTGLALVGLIAYGLWPRHHADVPLNISPAGTAAPWTSAATPEASSSPSPTFTNPDDQYFVGSPALSWADNEAGFVIPSAAALNGVSR